MSEADGRIRIRSYRGVLDGVERRIFRVDRWRLPNPNGISVRALIYGLGCVLAALIASTLPLISQILSVLPPSLRYLALPLLAAAALASWSPDGRAPHSALRSALRFAAAPRSLAGPRRTPKVGSDFAPVAAIQIAVSGDRPRYPSGRVLGPARLTLRYPAQLTLEGGRGRTGAEQLASCRRIRVREPVQGRGRPLARGRRIEVPEGAEVIFG